MPTTRIPVGVFAPDSEVVGGGSLRKAENVLPVAGSYRLLRKPEIVSTSADTDTDPISGGHVHLLTSDSLVQFGRPIADSSEVTLVAVQDQDGNDPDPDAEEGIYRSIDEVYPDTSDYIVSSANIADEAFIYACKLSELVDPAAASSSDYILRFRYKANTAETFQVDVRTASGSPSLVDSDDWADAGDDEWTIREFVLGDTEVDSNLGSFDDIYVLFRSDALTPVTTVYLPDTTDGNSGGWEGEGGETTLHDHVDALIDDAEYIVTPTMPAGGSNFWCTMGLPNQGDPVGHEDHVITLRGKRVTTDDADVHVRLKDGSTTITTATFTLSDTLSTQTYTLSEAEAALITDYNNLTYVVRAENTGTLAGTAQVMYLSWTLPQQGQFWLDWVEFQIPSASAGADTSKNADVNLQYVGTTNALYEINERGVWDDVSRAGSPAYAAGNDLPHSWSFATWGKDVIATNYVDEPQIKVPGSDFADMITTASLLAGEWEPQARFVAVVNNFLVLADINPDSVGDAAGASTLGTDVGNPYVVWWSAINDSTLFKLVDLTTQSDYQPLLDTPGGISGLVGGEWGTIFKRNAIYRMDYVGPDIIFTFNALSKSSGCSYPRSIVQVDSDIYYLGAGSIQVIRNGQEIQNLGDGTLTRWLLDGEFNDDSLAQRPDVDSRLVDSQVVGTYNPIDRCVWWMYTPASAAFNRERKFLVYNTIEDRFATLNLTIPGLTAYYPDHLMALRNSVVGSGPLSRLMQLYTHDPANGFHALNNFSNLAHEVVRLETSPFDATALAGDPMNVVINRVRPVFLMEEDNDQYPPITITVVSSETGEFWTSDSSTADFNDRDEGGWYPLDNLQAGEFFRIYTDVGETVSQFRYLIYWDVDWDPAGEV